MDVMWEGLCVSTGIAPARTQDIKDWEQEQRRFLRALCSGLFLMKVVS